MPSPPDAAERTRTLDGVMFVEALRALLSGREAALAAMRERVRVLENERGVDPEFKVQYERTEARVKELEGELHVRSADLAHTTQQRLDAERANGAIVQKNVALQLRAEQAERRVFECNDNIETHLSIISKLEKRLSQSELDLATATAQVAEAGREAGIATLLRVEEDVQLHWRGMAVPRNYIASRAAQWFSPTPPTPERKSERFVDFKLTDRSDGPPDLVVRITPELAKRIVRLAGRTE